MCSGLHPDAYFSRRFTSVRWDAWLPPLLAPPLPPGLAVLFSSSWLSSLPLLLLFGVWFVWLCPRVSPSLPGVAWLFFLLVARASESWLCATVSQYMQVDICGFVLYGYVYFMNARTSIFRALPCSPPPLSDGVPTKKCVCV